MQPITAQVLLDPDRRRLAEAIERHGERTVAEALGVSRLTLPRLIAGLRCRPAIVEIARQRLESLEVETLTRTIQVTAADIKAGIPCNEDSCPVALAVKRELSVSNVQAFDGGDIDGRARIFVDSVEFDDLSQDVREFIRAFDLQQPVEPFSVELPWIE